jgi:hypothetical protein
MDLKTAIAKIELPKLEHTYFGFQIQVIAF